MKIATSDIVVVGFFSGAVFIIVVFWIVLALKSETLDARSHALDARSSLLDTRSEALEDRKLLDECSEALDRRKK